LIEVRNQIQPAYDNLGRIMQARNELKDKDLFKVSSIFDIIFL
jgi:hypothetical protein